jgi:hypothetical protein
MRLGRGKAVSLLVAVAALAIGVPFAGPAHSAEAPTDVTPMTLSSGQFQLTDTSYAAATDNLYDNYLTDHANLTDVLTTNYTTNSSGGTDPWLNLRTMVTCPSSDPGLPPVTRLDSLCWSSSHEDDTTQNWYPQGISSTGMADGSDGEIEGDAALAVDWHYQDLPGQSSSGCHTQNMLKLTFIDRNTLQYRHVLLVVPTSTSSGASNFSIVTGHGGGIVWYAHYIFVTDTDHGIRVFDLDKMAKVDQYGSNISTYGISNGESSACGYPYVLPEIHQYFQAAEPSSKCASAGPIDPDYLCFSWLSLDKTNGTPYDLVTGEWYGGVNGGRIVRYELNPASATTDPGLPTTSGGKTIVVDAYTATHYDGLQGGMTWTDSSGTLNFDFNKGCGTQPGVFSHTYIGDTRATTTCAEGGNWAAGPPESMSYWPVLGSTQVDELWGLTEGLCLSPSDPNYTAPTSTLDVCDGYDGSGTESLRTVYAVGFDDPSVQAEH